MAQPQTVQLHPGDQARLERLLAHSSARSPLRVRAEIVLRAAVGASNTAIAAQCRVSRNTVALWRARYASLGLKGLVDLPRSGRPSTVNQTVVVAESLAGGDGASDLSTRGLGRRLGVGRSSVSDIQRRWGIDVTRPSQLPTIPALSGWARELLGVCLAPPEQAIAVTMSAGPPRSRADRAGVGPPLLDALSQLTVHTRALSGRVIADCPPAQPHEVCLDFFDGLVRQNPNRTIHVLFQNHTALEHPETRAWLARHATVRIHCPSAAPDWVEIAEVLLYTALQWADAPEPAGAARSATDALREYIRRAVPSARPLTWMATPSAGAAG